MNWEDECYLLSKRKFRENGNIVSVLTKNYGKTSGIVFGGNSRKIRNYLQISNKLYVINNSKNNNKIAYFKTELIKPISPIYFNDKKRTTALISICSILDTLLPEGQLNKKIYNLFNNFINSIELENWIFLYIFLELNIVKILGYDPDLLKFKDDKSKLSDFKKIKIDNFDFDIPYFLIANEIPKDISNEIIKRSLLFSRNMIQNRLYFPSNLSFPRSRIFLENYFDNLF